MALWQTVAVLLAFATWLQSSPASLADAARRQALRRQLMPPSAVLLTNEDVEDLPSRPLPVVATPAAEADVGAAPGAAAAEIEPRDEAWWRARIVEARESLERDRRLAGALQSRVNALATDWSARDDPAQRQMLYQERVRVLEELDRMQERIRADLDAIAQIEEEARRENVPPGWLR